MSVAPFPAEYRASGILLHVTSLPSPYGILPDNYIANTVVYTGTRDNPTTRGW